MSKQCSTAKVQYEAHQNSLKEVHGFVSKNLASFFLKLPIPMSYEVWTYLHKVKGDYIGMKSGEDQNESLRCLL